MSYTIPPEMTLRFDPFKLPALDAIFEDRMARTLFLAWKAGHVASQYFVFTCWDAARALRTLRTPVTVEQVASVLSDYMAIKGQEDFIKAFTPYVNGEKEIEWKVSDVGPEDRLAAAAAPAKRTLQPYSKSAAELTTWDKIADDEPVFVLRAQDATAPATVMDWVQRQMEVRKLSKASSEQDWAPIKNKLADAIECADAMMRWMDVKLPD